MRLNNFDYYKRSVKNFGNSYRSLGWNTKKAQAIRFAELLRDIDIRNRSILDFGCGYGDIIPYIIAKCNVFEYKGVDIISEFIKVARKTYKSRNIQFIEKDFLTNPSKESYDVVLSSGALNSNIIDAVKYRKKAIKILWDHTLEVLSFNMAGGYPQPKNKKNNRVFYANSLDILKYCFKFTSKVIFRHHYRRNDFTIVMFK